MMTAVSFLEQYRATAARNESLLCVGLDPDPELLPSGVDATMFLGAIIEATADIVCAYKPNAAFFEARDDGGLETVRTIVAAVPDGVPVLLDAKRSDIGNTARFYARAVFEHIGAGGVTANPYVGLDALQPFFDYADRHTFVLCRTSNPGGRDLQELPVGREGRPLYEHVAGLAREWNVHGNVGLVVGATYPEEARRVREICPDQLLLLPGVGAQQGAIEAAVSAAIDARGGGVLVNASRSVLYAGRDEPDFATRYAVYAREAAMRLRDAINAARPQAALA